MDTVLLFFGASTTQGIRDPEGGWVGRLTRFLMSRDIESENTNFTVFNLGVSGDDTRGLLSRMEPEMKARKDPDERAIIGIAIGTNDSAIIDGKIPHTTPDSRARITACP